MYSYMIGTVTEVNTNHITLEIENKGYIIYVPNPIIYSLRCEYKIFIYHHVSEKTEMLFGFSTSIHKLMFLKFLNVKGIGTQTALILANCDQKALSMALRNNDVNFFCTLPKIGKKLAHQIILELGTDFIDVTKDSYIEELTVVLTQLGNDKHDIDLFIQTNTLNRRLQEDINNFIEYKKRTY